LRIGRTGEHPGDILEELDAVVERPAGNHVEGDIGVSDIDALAAGFTGDHGENDHPETVHQARLEKRPAQGQAAQRAQTGHAVPLHRSHSRDWVLPDELGIGHDNGAFKVEENTTLGDLVSSAMASSSLVVSSDSEASDSAANPPAFDSSYWQDAVFTRPEPSGHRPPLTVRLNRLQRAGLIERLPNPRDGRGVLVRLTPLGKELAEDALATLLNTQAASLGTLRPPEQADLANLLRTLLIALGDTPAFRPAITVQRG
jgi:hypothetical protein